MVRRDKQWQNENILGTQQQRIIQHQQKVWLTLSFRMRNFQMTFQKEIHKALDQKENKKKLAPSFMESAFCVYSKKVSSGTHCFMWLLISS